MMTRIVAFLVMFSFTATLSAQEPSQRDIDTTVRTLDALGVDSRALVDEWKLVCSDKPAKLDYKIKGNDIGVFDSSSGALIETHHFNSPAEAEKWAKSQCR
jgi:hypothetical protein